MARNEILVDAPAARVWDVLADPALYAEWVAGTAETRHRAGRWPERGSSLNYDVGAGPFRIGDQTTVIEAETHERLLLRARAGRVATIRVEISLKECDGMTLIRIDEDVSGGAAGILPDLITDLLIKARNVWSLERLRDLAEVDVRSPVAAGSAPATP
jgi:hypothetical protein